MKDSLNIAIAGATGNVGRKIIEVLEKKDFPVNNLYLLASKNSEGKKVKFFKKEIVVEDLTNFDFSKACLSALVAFSQFSSDPTNLSGRVLK